MSEDTIVLKSKGLKDLMRAFRGKLPVASIGIMGDKNSRGGDGKTTNAEVGAAHEFGTSNLPIRSFLRMPLSTQLNSALESSGAFDRAALDAVAQEKSLLSYVKKIAVVAEGVVQEAFSTEGWGKWPPWKDPHYSNNANMILTDTQKLRNSISSRVK